MWGRRLAAMLTLYTSKGVTPEVNLMEHTSHTPLPSMTKAEPTLALKSRGDVTRSPKEGYQWPHKWTCFQQFFFKKTKKTKKQQQCILSWKEPTNTPKSKLFYLIFEVSSSSVASHWQFIGGFLVKEVRHIGWIWNDVSSLNRFVAGS